MSSTESGSESPFIYVGKSWAVPDEADYGDLAGKGVHYSLEYNNDELPSVADIAATARIIPFTETGPEKFEHGPGNRVKLYEDMPDDRAQHHHNTVGLKKWMRVHAYRKAEDWGPTKLANWLDENREATRQFGFTNYDKSLDQYTVDPPSQERLSEMWNDVFTKAEQTICEKLAEQLFLIAYHNSLPLPKGPFEPEKKRGTSEQSKRRLRESQTRDIWREGKGIISDNFYLDRAENARIPEGSFWEAQAAGGLLSEVYSEGAIDAYRQDTTRPVDQIHTGRTHRHHIRKHSVEDLRSMFHEAVKELAKRARHSGKLQGEIWAAIDTTKGSPWTGDIEWTEGKRRDHPKNPHLLGYKNDEHEKYGSGNYYYQWITIHIVGMDIPLVLDAKPLKRGYDTAEHVAELISNALDIVPDLDLVMFDRAFDSDKIKGVCDEQGVHYLNPTRKFASEKAMCTQLRRAGRKVGVIRDEVIEGPDRYQLYVPAKNEDVHERVEEEDSESECETTVQTKLEDEKESFRDKLADDLEKTVDVDFDADDDHPFTDVVEEYAEEEEIKRGRKEDASAYAVFETNHPRLNTEFDDDDQLLASIEAFLERYSHRWGIENGYKKIKQFRVRSASDDHSYRFFNFLFSCLLYNIWRLVDILLKLAFEDNPDYTPRLKAASFLTVAKQSVGKGPPD